MRKVFFVFIVLCLTSLSASAAVITWEATLSGTQEIPSNPATATGFGRVTFDDSTNVLSLELDWAGLSGLGRQAHIHCCVATPPGNVGIALDLWLTSDPPRAATDSYDATYDLDLVNPFRTAFTTANGGTALSAFAALSAAMTANQGRAYYNIHTDAFPGGEIRGNLSLVPEPGTMLAFLSGIGALIAYRRVRRG